MSLTIDATSSRGNTSGSGNISWSHTCSGNKRVLFVMVSNSGAPGGVAATYNGVSMTKIGSNNSEILFGLIAPATGSNTISVTGTDYATGSAISFNGAHQTVAWGTAQTASGTDTTASVSVTSDVNQYVVDCMGWTSKGWSIGAGQTLIATAYYDYGTSDREHHSSYEPGAASTTMSWTAGTAGAYNIIAVNVLPALGTPVIWYG